MRIALIDYGAGNLASVRKGFAAAGVDLLVPSTSAELADCAGLVVPGVGHFAATSALDASWRQAIIRRVDAGVPLLGICLGMQWLLNGSAEAPDIPGLGLIAGRCERMVVERPLKVPHVGWNALRIQSGGSLLEGVEDGTQVYFTHSFAALVSPDCTAAANHGQPFAAVVQRGHVAGVQFHPEKSGEAGVRMLRNFVTMARG